MKIEITQELTAVMKTTEIASEQVCTWARTVEAQRVQKPHMEATKDNKE